jgi:hypothetical protein
MRDHIRPFFDYVSQGRTFVTHTMYHVITKEHFGVARGADLGNKVDKKMCY